MMRNSKGVNTVMYLLKKKKRNKDFGPLNEREGNEIHICTKILPGILGEGCKKGCDVTVAGGPRWKP